jgi:membrane protease YdiL (CAAX protease family)
MLVIVQALLALLVTWTLRAEGLGWRDLGWLPANGQSVGRELLIGGGLGAGLGLAYVFALSPMLTALQRALGDYVPPGELLPTLGTEALPFFIANVLMAPLVEEAVYRGYALPRLAGRFGPRLGLALSGLFFGLLHWAGGLWYIVLTGLVAGGLLGGLRLWRGNLSAAFAAHLALNAVEFLFVWLAAAR